MKKHLNVETTETAQATVLELKSIIAELVNREVAYQSHRYYTGKVIDNNDPNQLGRVKIRVFGVFDDVKDVDLPWALSEDRFVGSLAGSQIIPPNDAILRVYFDNGDIYTPIYTSKLPMMGAKGKQLGKQRGKNYPDNMVFFETDDGDYFTINRKTKMLTLATATGATITINKKGDISIDTSIADSKNGGNFSISVNGDVNLKSVGNITIDAAGKLTDIPVVDPLDQDLTDPTKLPEVTPSTSRAGMQSTGQTNIVSLGKTDFLSTPEIPDPRDVDALLIAGTLAPFSKNAINIVTPTGRIEMFTGAGEIRISAPVGKVSINSAVGVEVISPNVTLGNSAAVDNILLSTKFATFFDQHTHPTPSGPSSFPLPPMNSLLATMISPMVKV